MLLALLSLTSLVLEELSDELEELMLPETLADCLSCFWRASGWVATVVPVVDLVSLKMRETNQTLFWREGKEEAGAGGGGCLPKFCRLLEEDEEDDDVEEEEKGFWNRCVGEGSERGKGWSLVTGPEYFI